MRVSKVLETAGISSRGYDLDAGLFEALLAETDTTGTLANEAISIVRDGIPIQVIVEPVPTRTNNNLSWARADPAGKRQTIESDARLGFIRAATSAENPVISPLTAVPKPGGKVRRCWDPSEWQGKCLALPTATINGWQQFTSQLSRQDHFAAKVDLKNGFMHLRIKEADQRLTGFRDDEGKTWVYQRMPFGLHAAPYYFTRVTECLAEALRNDGVKCAIHMDDFIVFGSTAAGVNRDLALLKEMLTKLGFVINEEKSSTRAASQLDILGHTVDLVSHRFTLGNPEALMQRIRRMESCPTRRNWARVLGTLNFHIPKLQHHLRGRLNELYAVGNGVEWDEPVHPSARALRSLRYLTSAVTGWGLPLFANPRPRDTVIFTDASNIGQGFVSLKAGQYRWEARGDARKGRIHITQREAEALLWATRQVKPGDAALLLTDSATTLKAVIAGGARASATKPIIRAIHQHIKNHRLDVRFAHVRTDVNLADIPSRLGRKTGGRGSSDLVVRPTRFLAGREDVTLLEERARINSALRA